MMGANGNNGQKLEQFFARALKASSAQVQSSQDRVLSNLRSEVEEIADFVAPRRVPGRRTPLRILIVAAALVIVSVVAIVQTRREPVYNIGDVARWTGPGTSTLSVADGSRIELRPGTEFSVEQAIDGFRLNLKRGGIIVNAAKQRTGHLYVQTKDMTVSVIGTVFLVNTEAEGSRVAVIEGEVRVQQGATEKKLHPGEQVQTSPLREFQPVSHEIAWSSRALEHMALLQQSPVVPAGPQKAFELASIRPSGSAPSGGGRGGAPPLRCSELFLDLARDGSVIWRVQIDPKRFVVTRTNLYTLIAWAYGMDCDNSSRAGLISGGPGWIISDDWDIQANIQEGTPIYTPRQFVAGNAPALQEQLRGLLETRFKLVLRREMNDAPVYVLTLGKRPLNLTPDAGPLGHGALTGGTDENGQKYNKFMRVPTTNFARMLMLATNRAVLDRTDIKGDFTLNIEFAPFNGNAPSSRPSLFKALEDVGLKLEEVKVPLEGLIIDRVEKPSEN